MNWTTWIVLLTINIVLIRSLWKQYARIREEFGKSAADTGSRQLQQRSSAHKKSENSKTVFTVRTSVLLTLYTLTQVPLNVHDTLKVLSSMPYDLFVYPQNISTVIFAVFSSLIFIYYSVGLYAFCLVGRQYRARIWKWLLFVRNAILCCRKKQGKTAFPMSRRSASSAVANVSVTLT